MSDPDAPIFRAPKRRKTTTAPKSSHQSDLQSKSKSDSDSENDQSTEFVKPRIQVKARTRPNGMQFSNANVRQSQSNVIGNGDESMALVPVETAESKGITHGLNNRFVVSGMGIGVGRDVVENDPNITAYIDAEMARRRHLQTSQFISTQPHNPQTAQAAQPTIPKQTDQGVAPAQQSKASRLETTATTNPPQDPTKSLSQSHPQLPPPTTHQPTEIDLSTHPPPPSNTQPLPKKKPPKPHLGRDGKPYRPRPRRGPNEEDIARSALVEQVLSEYHDGLVAGGVAEVGSGNGGGNAAGKLRGIDEEADERMEREFRTQFLERSANTSGGAGGGGKAGTGGSGTGTGTGDGKKDGGNAGVLSGPRLGGSRSARARMVAALEREREKEKEKEKERGGDGK